MTTTHLLDPQVIHQAYAQKSGRKKQPNFTVTVSRTYKNGGKHLRVPSPLLSVLGETTTHVALEHDVDGATLTIRPSIWGEPAFRLYDTSRGSGTRTIRSNTLFRYLGLEAYDGTLPVKVKDGRLVVSLKRGLKKTAADAA